VTNREGAVPSGLALEGGVQQVLSMSGGRMSDERAIVLVVGPGRSGTSTMGGVLSALGYEVPGRAIKGNPTNPAGFFEPRWVVDFHRELLDRAAVATLDVSPKAIRRVRRVSERAQAHEQLRPWLAKRLRTQPRLVVKDPRLVWFEDLWVACAKQLDVEPRFVTMLRHPVEVVQSRKRHYAKIGADRVGADITQIAGWVNVTLLTERLTSGSPRLFVRYTDLTADWRSVMNRADDVLGLGVGKGLETTPHAVDEFIDPSLHRERAGWEALDVARPLTALAEDVWKTMGRLADVGEQQDVLDELDALRGSYARMVKDAVALSQHMIKRARVDAAAAARRKALAAPAPADQPPDQPPDQPRLAARVVARALRRGAHA
jgi:hypothetical protein